MTLVKWKPRQSLLSQWTNWERSIGDLFNEDFVPTNSKWSPAVDISEDEKSYQLAVDLPGLTKKDIRVNLKDGALSISGERAYESENRGDIFCRVERGYGAFERRFRLPVEVQEDQIDATFKNGVLTVQIPKVEEEIAKEFEIKIS